MNQYTFNTHLPDIYGALTHTRYSVRLLGYQLTDLRLMKRAVPGCDVLEFYLCAKSLSPLILKTILEGSLNYYFQVIVEETKASRG